MATLTGTNSADNILGTAGTDTILSGNGNDYVSAGAGNDYVDGGNGDDIIEGGSGDDTLLGGNGKDRVFGGLGNDVLLGGNGVDAVYGGSGDDVIGSLNGDTESAGTDNGGDTLYGDGFDTYADYLLGRGHESTQPGNDRVYGGNGDDLIYGDNGDNAVMGGNDFLYGGKGNDTIYGEGGNDTIQGGAGADKLSGGSGRDVFVYSAVSDSTAASMDVITDFVRGSDQIDLRPVLGSSGFQWGGGTPTAHGAWFEQSGGNTYVYVDVDGNPGQPEMVIRLNGLHELTKADFAGYEVSAPVAATITASASEDVAVTEAGGSNNAVAGDPSASGTLTVHDVDSGEAHFATVAPESLTGTYGTFTFDSNSGAWTYMLDNSKADVLTVGQQVNDSLTVHSADQTAQQTITVNITGSNDSATITASAGEDVAVTEAGGTDNAVAGDPSASGTLTVHDVDSGEAHFATVAPESLTGTYGTFTFDSSSGAWTYTLDNTKADALTVGQQVNDSLTVHSADESTQQTITVNITGSNDSATITASASEDVAVTEAGGANNAVAGDPSASGTLTVHDVDSGEAHFATVAPDSLTGTYGTFTFDSNSGAWTYTLDNTKADGLTAGQQVTDSLTVHSADLTAQQTVTVNITGSNDTAVNVVPAAQAVDEDTPLVFSAANGNGISFSDVDNSTHTVTLSVTHGALTLDGTAGLTFLAGDGSSDSTMTFTGSDAAIQAALDGMSFLGDKDYAGAASLQIRTDDGTAVDTDSVAIAIHPVNDAPVAAGDVVYASNNTSGILIPVSALLGNDADIDGSALTITALGAGSGGVSGVQFAPGTNDSFITFQTGNSSSGSFTYTVSDGAGGTSTATVTVNISSTNGAATVSLADVSYQASYLDGGSNSDALTGAGVSDFFVGGAAADTLKGGAGDDTLRGGAGNDILDGGAGIDMLDFSDATAGFAFTLVQGSGSTQVDLTSVGLDKDTYSNMEGVIGSKYNDTLTGSNANDILRGGAGNDMIDGGAGIDLLDFSDATGALNFTLVQGSTATAVNLAGVGLGTDTYKNMEGVIGSSFNDTLTGSAGNDVLRGGAGNDILLGGDGNDTLVGGAGADTLTGGAGTDTFGFLRADAASVDTITDFNVNPTAAGGDVLDLSDLLSGMNVTGANAAQFIHLSEVGGNTVVSVDRDGGGTGAAFQDVAVLQGVAGVDLNTLLSNGNIHTV